MNQRSIQRKAGKRIKQANELFARTLSDLDQDVPDSRSRVLFMILKIGLRTLRSLLDDPKSCVSWRDPMVEFDFPIQIHWESWETTPMAVRFVTREFTSKNTITKAHSLRAISKALVTHLVATHLHECTFGVAIEKRGKKLVPVLTDQLAEQYSAITSPAKKQIFLNEAFRPFSMGAGEIELPAKGQDLSDEQSLSASQIDIPPVWVPFEKDGHQLRFAWILRISPLIVHVEQRRAYHPITVGIVILPKETEDHQSLMYELGAPWLNPSTWSASDRRAFWKITFELLNGLSSFKMEGDSKQDGSVSEAAAKSRARRLELQGPVSDLKKARQEINQMLLDFHKHGGCLKIAWDSDEASVDSSKQAELLSLLGKVDRAMTAEAKGKTLEDLLSKLFESVPGLVCKTRVVTATEEIDLSIANSSKDEWLSRMKPVILVECKNWAGPSDKNSLVAFERKVENRRGQCNLGFFISWNGFTAKFETESIRSSQHHYVIARLDRALIKQAIESGAIRETLFEAYFTATHT